jgi:carbonic anhydrase
MSSCSSTFTNPARKSSTAKATIWWCTSYTDQEGKLAVVAVLLATTGANPLIKTLWDNLPEEKETETVVDTVKINVADLLPTNKAYYTFAGSLTTPRVVKASHGSF